MERTYTNLTKKGARAVEREAEEEGLEVSYSRRSMIIEGDEESVSEVSERLKRNYNNGDGAGILSREEYPRMFW